MPDPGHSGHRRRVEAGPRHRAGRNYREKGPDWRPGPLCSTSPMPPSVPIGHEPS